VTGVERLDDPFDRATLAGGIFALEDQQHARTRLAVELTAESQAQLEQSLLRSDEPGLILRLLQAVG